jgi:ABC-type sugar transport system ATPase subunit
VLISHNMNEVLQVADSIAVLYLGQMAAQVSRSEVNQHSSSSSSRPAAQERSMTADDGAPA